jgi:hypothetical protein
VSNSEDFVMVPVPADRVMEVYALLTSEPVGGASSAKGPEGTAEWGKPSLVHLLELVSYRAQLLVEALAEDPGQAKRAEELAGRIGIQPGPNGEAQLQGLIGNIKKNANWVSRDLPANLPLPFDMDKDSKGLKVSMDEKIARLVKTSNWRRRPKPAGD